MVDIVKAGEDAGAVPYEASVRSADEETENSVDAERQGPDADWRFWEQQITAGLLFERRWRHEAREAEDLQFGPDISNSDKEGTLKANKVTDETSLIHGNIEVLKPLLYSQEPTPVIRRRFRGHGKVDETDIMAAEVSQRLAEYLIDTSSFDDAMKGARDDWIVAGRGAARVFYHSTTAMVDIEGPLGKIFQTTVKTSEEVKISHVPWERLIMAPGHTWDEMPWIAFEIPYTRTQMRNRFGDEIAGKISYDRQGIIGADDAPDDTDRDSDRRGLGHQLAETDAVDNSPFDTCRVFEIWNREQGEVVWWTKGYTDGVLDRDQDILLLEKFWPMPKPLLGKTKGPTMAPRPDILYYKKFAKEVDEAGKKLLSLLRVISVSGAIPGSKEDEIKKLLQGNNVMVAIKDWAAFMEGGGLREAIQWLPLQPIVQAINALLTLREQAKNAMFEASGVSDIMRAQGDPNETATAQQIKGRYAGLRLEDKQRIIAIYSRDMIKLMLELAVEHFDTSTIADITGIDLPATEMERQAILAKQEQAKQTYAALAQAQQQLAQAGMQVQDLPPPPEFDRVPETSWELVHGRLSSDLGRKLTIVIETKSTILADEQADKEARIEFLTAFATFVQQIGPMIDSGQFDLKTAKELLLFGIKAFPNSRVLEGMINDMPDEPKGKGAPDPSVQVAQIGAEVDIEIEKMRSEEKQRDRDHELKMVASKTGGDIMKDAAGKMVDAQNESPPERQNVPA